jgi:hypothetical protein
MPIDPRGSLVVCKYLAYSYREESGSITFMRLPMVHIGLETEDKAYDTAALVDSGVTTTLIPREDAEILDCEYVEKESGEILRVDTSGAGGKFYSNITTLKKLDIMKKRKVFTSFSELKVLVPETENTLPYPILGRDYLFKRYEITFQENRQKMMFMQA